MAWQRQVAEISAWLQPAPRAGGPGWEADLLPPWGQRDAQPPRRGQGIYLMSGALRDTKHVSQCHLIVPTNHTLVTSLRGLQSISEFEYLQCLYGTPNVCRIPQKAGNAGAWPCLPLHSCSLPPSSSPSCSRPLSLCCEANGWQSILTARLCFPSQQQIIVFLPLRDTLGPLPLKP